jgi:Spy/CpxP family protein refolding chaperone
MYRTFGLAAAAFLLLASLASAQPEPGTKSRHEPMRMRQQFFDRMGLSDQQKDQIRKLRLGLQKEITQLHATIRIDRIDLQELFTADKLDRGAIEKKVSAISDLQHSSKMKLLDHMFAVNALLTPEQQKIWKEHMGRFDARPMGPMRRGGLRRQMFGEGMPGMDQQPGDDVQEIEGDGMN